MSQSNGPIRFGQFSLDTDQLILRRSGTEIPLPPKALALLSALVENRGKIVSKQQLLDTVWADTFVEEGNLAYTVRILRKVLEDDATAPKYIESIPRRGYRFVAACFDESRTRLAQNDALPFPARASTPDESGLIGRETAVSEVVGMLMAEGTRLVTLTGTGGTGKTRLAREISVQARPIFPDGVEMVELANVSDPAMVPLTIAQELGIADTGSSGLLQVISERYRDKAALLILDNFEQILPAGSDLARLLKDTPGLKLLVTSREPLKISAEKEYRVPPLDLPDAAPTTLSGAMQSSAVRLFLKRASESRPGFEPSEADGPLLSSICRKLDGIPLALELAASRLKVLSLAELDSKLENRLALLKSGSRDTPDRHRTMRTTIEWSYGLLSDVDKEIFRSLSVFEGGFTFQAAEHIATAIQPGLPDTAVVDSIESLTEKGLLVAESESGATLRFRMLVVVRDYALEVAADRWEQLSRLHAVYFHDLVADSSSHIFLPDALGYLNLLGKEMDNIRAALRWGLAHDNKTAASIMAVIRHVVGMRMHVNEARHWLDRCLADLDSLPIELQIELLTGRGVVCQYQLDLEASRASRELSLKLSRQIGDRKHEARDLRGLAALEYIEGRPERAIELTNETLSISREIGDEFGEAAALSRLGDIFNFIGEPDRAKEHIIESIRLFRKVGYIQGVLGKIFNLSITEFYRGDLEACRTNLGDGLDGSTKIGDEINLRLGFDIGAAVRMLDGDYKTAARLAGVAAAHCANMNYFHEPMELQFRERYLDTLRTKISAEDFAAEFALGEQMPLNEAIDLAKSVCGGRPARSHLRVVGKRVL